MEERRKAGDRRVQPNKQRRPLNCTRHMADRRQNKQPIPKKHWTAYDIDLITRCLTGKEVG